MTARQTLAKIAVILVVMIALVASGIGRQAPVPPLPQRHYVPTTPLPRIEWLHNQWLRTCPPFHSEICAG